MIYCQAILPRAGLGNRLFPWARCRLFAHLNNIQMIGPIWHQLKVGPILRGESDARLYYNLFHSKNDQVKGLKRALIRIAANKLPEPDDLTTIDCVPTSERTLFLFRGERDHFNKLNGWDLYLHDELRAIARNQWLRRVNDVKDVPIGIHVRRGDFRTPYSDKEFFTSGGLRVPLSWFVESLKLVRNYAGAPVKAFVFSDGDEAELSELLAMENVTHVATGSAIGDLLILLKAKGLIASGGSSFSAWGSFLGQMPTISHPGQSLSWFKLKNKHGYYVGEFDPSAPAQAFIDSALMSLGQRDS